MLSKIGFLLCVIIITILTSCGAPVKIVKFDTKPEAPFRGDSVTLYWVVENATEVALNGIPVAKDTGMMRVLLDRSQSFILRAHGSHSEATNKLDVVAQPK